MDVRWDRSWWWRSQNLCGDVGEKMTSRVKEDERIEKIIRSLLKLPENRRCINCNSLGPQYVCTTFLTFVCTNCSGVHREFTHRVKSVSMAKFTAEEVSALQAGGNERARQIYFKAWDPQRHSFPDGSNLHRLRDFIKHVFVDRKYTGERSTEMLPRLKLSDKEDSNKKVDMYERRYNEQSNSGGRNDDRSFKYYYDERRSPRYAQENNRYGGYKRSPARFEVVDDRFRDDGVGSGRKSHSRRFSNVESVQGTRSLNSKNYLDGSKSPVVRPVSDILGENVPRLQIGELSNANDRGDTDGSAPNLKIAPSSNVKSADGNPVKHKRENSGSLIDFNTNPEPPDASPVPQAQKVPPSINAGDWTSSGSSAKEKASHPPSENTLESLLSQLIVPPPVPAGDMHEVFSSGSVPSTAPVGNMLMLPAGGVSPAAYEGDMSALPQGVGAPATNPSTNLLMPREGALVDASTIQPTNVTMPPPGGSAAAAAASATNSSTNLQMKPPNGSSPSAASTANPSANVPMPALIGGAPSVATSGIIPASPHSSDENTVQVTNAQLPSMQQSHPSASSAVDTAQQASPMVGALDDQLWALSLASNEDGPATASAEQSSQDVSKPVQDNRSGGGLQSMEVKSSGRKELPLDLFTATYSAVPAPVSHWPQSSQHHVMGFGMQYHPAALPMPAYPNPTTSTNPFDINSGTVQATMFPSMASMQEAPSNVSAPTGSLHTSSLGTQPPQLMLTQSPSYPSSEPPRSPSYASTISQMSSGGYTEQQALSNMPPSGMQGYGSFGSGGAEFSSLSTNQHSTGRYTGLTSPNSFVSGGGNPFG